MTRPEIGKSIKTGDYNTNYHDIGEGFHVILAHGSGPGVTAWANWRLIIPILSKNRRVIAPDFVGFGYTDRPEGMEYNMKNWVKQMIDFLDALGLDQVDMIGNSFGGALSLAMAVEYPERIRKVVLMGSAGTSFPITKGLEEVWGYTPSAENMKNIISTMVYDGSIATDDLAQMRYEATIMPGFQEAFSSMFPAPRQRWLDSMARTDEELMGIDKPVLIVHGREDRVVPLESSYKIFSLIKNARLHVFGQCGHWTQIEHTDEFASLVDDFLTLSK